MIRQPLRTPRQGKQEIGRTAAGPSPVKGWNTRDALASMDVGYATLLDNWIPDVGRVETRAGAVDWTTGLGQVKSTFAWQGVSGRKLFASTNTGLYDATSSGAVGAVSLARTNGYGHAINFTTTGGHFLVTVNGTDDLAYFNGTTWATVASFPITGGGTLTTSAISNISSFKRSIFFIGKDSTSFYYLPIDSITGTVSEFPLGALFTKGGKLIASSTWTIDGGFGVDDYCAFITDRGQVAVYKGTDPSSSTTWELRGVYDLAFPVGEKCFCRFGGDLLVLTSRGLTSMTQVLRTGLEAVTSNLSSVIGEAFQEAFQLVGAVQGWEVLEYPTKNLLICNIPQLASNTYYQFVMNTKTGAWSRWTGWNCTGFAVLGTALFAGFSNKTGSMLNGLRDFGSPITYLARTAFSYYSPRSRLKSWKAVRPLIAITGNATVYVGLDTDFQPSTSFDSSLSDAATLSVWDTATWDSGTWVASVLHNEWLTVAGADSYSAAIRLRAVTQDAIITWSGVDVLYTVGSII